MSKNIHLEQVKMNILSSVLIASLLYMYSILIVINVAGILQSNCCKHIQYHSGDTLG